MNKRALIHAADLMYTLVLSFFMLLFIGWALSSGISGSNEDSLELVASYDYLTSGLSNVLYQANIQTTFLVINTNEAIRNSIIIGNNIITTCFDITTEQNCNSYTPNNKDCKWSNGVCQNE